MRTSVKLFFVSLCFLSVTACKTTVQDGPTKVTVEDGTYHGNGDFCPPGQAKKGNC